MLDNVHNNSPQDPPSTIRQLNTLLGLTEINSFDVYEDNNIVHLLASGSTSNTAIEEKSIRYTRSYDGGRLWTDPIEINKGRYRVLATRGNDVQLAAWKNNLIALWQTIGELPGMGPLASAYSKDGGKTWHSGGNPSSFQNGDQSHSDIVADKNGTFHSVWLEDPEENGYQSIRYSKSIDDGLRWEPARTLDDTTCSCCWNILKSNHQGNLYLLYRDMKPRDMSLLQSLDSGKSWHSHYSVGKFNWQFDGCPHNGGALAISEFDNSPVLHSLVWTGADTKQGLYYLRSNNQGNDWTMPQKVGNKAIHADIANIGNRLLIVWDEIEPEGSRIYYQKSIDSGISWTTASPLSLKENTASHPKVITVLEKYLIFWTERKPKQPNNLVFTYGS